MAAERSRPVVDDSPGQLGMRVVGLSLTGVAVAVYAGTALPAVGTGPAASVLGVVTGVLGPIFAILGPGPSEALAELFESIGEYAP